MSQNMDRSFRCNNTINKQNKIKRIIEDVRRTNNIHFYLCFNFGIWKKNLFSQTKWMLIDLCSFLRHGTNPLSLSIPFPQSFHTQQQQKRKKIFIKKCHVRRHFMFIVHAWFVSCSLHFNALNSRLRNMKH